MSRVGLHHVQVSAPIGCEADARWFYGDLIGLAEIERPESLAQRGGVWFGLGAQELHIGVQEPFSPAWKAHPALSVPIGDLDALAQRLLEAGVKVSWDDALPGIRRFYSKDPWGNRIEVRAGSQP